MQGTSSIYSSHLVLLAASKLRCCLFVRTSKELSEALNSIASRDVEFYEKIEFFNLDSELPRWKKLLLETNTYD